MPPPAQKKFWVPDNDLDLVRLATLLDCEGHITIGSELAKRKRVIHVGITNTHRPTIDWLESLGGHAHLKRKTSIRSLDCWMWQMNGRPNVIAMLEAVLPFMHMKREKAERALALLYAWTS